MVRSSKTDNENSTDVACRVSYCAEVAGEVHRVAETVMKPRAVGMATCVLREQSQKKHKSVPVLNNAVNLCIQGSYSSSSSSSSTGFYNSLAGFSLLILEVSRSHTMTQHSR
jgi:hypothetical protein